MFGDPDLVKTTVATGCLQNWAVQYVLIGLILLPPILIIAVQNMWDYGILIVLKV